MAKKTSKKKTGAEKAEEKDDDKKSENTDSVSETQESLKAKEEVPEAAVAEGTAQQQAQKENKDAGLAHSGEAKSVIENTEEEKTEYNLDKEAEKEKKPVSFDEFELSTHKRVSSIIFGILSPKMVKDMSSAKVVTPELYDKEGYPVDGGLMDIRLGVIDPGLK